MAFGLFKKKETADIIFMGVRIYTQDPDLPWAGAVACRDGRVLAVGDFEDLAEFEGSETEVVDLEGGVMLPGYIDTCGHPVLRVFAEQCLLLPEGMDLADTLGRITDHIEANADAETFFILGYDEKALDGHDNESARALLDEIESERPVAVLGSSGIHSWFNTAAIELVKAAAQEEQVENINLPYILNTLAPFDYEALQEAVVNLAGSYCEKGFTSVFECGAPDYLEGLYQDILIHMFQEDMAKQRYFGSLLVNRPVDPLLTMRKLSQKKTNCNELDEYLNFNALKLLLDHSGDAPNIPHEALSALCLEAGDKGFSVHIDAVGKPAVTAALEALEATRSAGYKKNLFLVAHNERFEEGELADSSLGMGVLQVPSALCAYDVDWHCLEGAKDVSEAVDRLTIDAAERLGADDRLGSIRRGMYADFVIFNDDPLEADSVEALKQMNCVMTVLNGQIVYDAEEDDMSDWYALFSAQQY